jgi:hypothetical protein
MFLSSINKMSFDWMIYRELNADLVKCGLRTKQEYERHYAIHGKKDGRYYLIQQVYEDFDWLVYRNNYSDLGVLSKSNVELHWLQYGRKEGRTYKKIIRKAVYVLVNIKSGGTDKYVKDLLKHLDANIIVIGNKQELNKINFNKTDILLVQQLLHIDIRVPDILAVYKKYEFRMMICIHDFCWLNVDIYDLTDFCPHRVYMNTNDVMSEVKELFKAAETVIHPTKFTFDEYSKRMSNKNFKIVPHIDYRCDIDRVFVPKVDNMINIGILNQKTEVKGQEYVDLLMTTYKAYNEKIINYYAVSITIGQYKESEFFTILSNYNIHGILLLNKWGETWSYLLTKVLISGLPILYNNIGSYRYRIKEGENKFKVGDKDGEIDLASLWLHYENMLDYILKKGVKQIPPIEYNLQIDKPNFYIELCKNK